MADADPLALAVRLGLYVVLGLAFGLPSFTLYSRTDDVIGLRAVLVGLSIGGLTLSVLGLAILAASMAGIALTAVDAAALGAIIALPGIGAAWMARMAALLLLLAASAVGRPRPLAVIGSGMGTIALASLAWTGHGNISGGVWAPIHLVADIVHLLAAGSWLGALVGLCLLVARSARNAVPEQIARTHAALTGFSTIGSVVVGLIVVSGLVNTWTVIGLANITSPPVTLYGRLFLAKLGLFTAMLALAAANRFRLTPALERAVGDLSRQLAALRASLVVETSLALAILALVAWLGLLAPPGTMG